MCLVLALYPCAGAQLGGPFGFSLPWANASVGIKKATIRKTVNPINDIFDFIFLIIMGFIESTKGYNVEIKNIIFFKHIIFWSFLFLTWDFMFE